MNLSLNTTLVPVARTVRDLRAVVQHWRAEGQSIALVPTMGALHEGHLSLVDLAGTCADKVVVSLFVNPTQFGPTEDFARYPRDEAADTAKLASRDVDLLYAPVLEEVYPQGHVTTISVPGVGEGLEGDHRPQFFTGVATIVLKLLLQVMPDVAVFGEKDFQQLQVIKRLVADLNLPVEIVGGPTVREADGLAMSSRNLYLSAEQRRTAGLFNKILGAIADQLAMGAPIAPTLTAGRQSLLRSGFDTVDYLELRHADGLAPVKAAMADPTIALRLLAVVRVDGVRLLDNMPVGSGMKRIGHGYS